MDRKGNGSRRLYWIVIAILNILLLLGLGVYETVKFLTAP
jgi:hypothetical protein